MEFQEKLSNAVASGLLAIAVSLGALGSHFLKARLTNEALDSFEVGVRYLMYHALAIILINNITYIQSESKDIFVKLVLAGVFLFSGSIFLLSTKQLHGLPVKYLGPVTPTGGVLIISAWVYLTLSFLKK
ncbi:MAG: hypothetical protein CMP52_01530 [Flavobacteriales bacterium]|jgi:uncharacterized membrane protein YgdD (TMEM256/DUF423 family)|nr:hypothetical protein [Candidatus Arcticimaribacter sp.]|tara:strand:- start:13283 stop:13672 length:390 start_codon:yes stop_codon:yes gene_type:complete